MRGGKAAGEPCGAPCGMHGAKSEASEHGETGPHGPLVVAHGDRAGARHELGQGNEAEPEEPEPRETRRGRG
jgi:hypothetical protein